MPALAHSCFMRGASGTEHQGGARERRGGIRRQRSRAWSEHRTRAGLQRQPRISESGRTRAACRAPARRIASPCASRVPGYSRTGPRPNTPCSRSTCCTKPPLSPSGSSPQRRSCARDVGGGNPLVARAAAAAVERVAGQELEVAPDGRFAGDFGRALRVDGDRDLQRACPARGWCRPPRSVISRGHGPPSHASDPASRSSVVNPPDLKVGPTRRRLPPSYCPTPDSPDLKVGPTRRGYGAPRTGRSVQVGRVISADAPAKPRPRRI